MRLSIRTKNLLLIVGDLIVLYLSLFITLALRYGNLWYDRFIDSHLYPFSFIFIVWLIVFYVAGLYDLRHLRNTVQFLKTLGLALFINALLTIAFFYLIPAFTITPKTNLFIFIVIFSVFEVAWRRFFNRRTAHGEAPNRVILVGNDQTTAGIYETLTTNPQLGYSVLHWEKEEGAELPHLEEQFRKFLINLIVTPRHLKKDEKNAKFLYHLLSTGVEIRDTASFYETIFQKIPLTNVEEVWFLEHIAGEPNFYDQIKQGFEFLTALILAIILLPLEILIVLLIKLTSPGPVIYRQTRIGKNEKPFTLYKFRTMRNDAEKNGVQWSGRNDTRVTPFGKFLRYSHLDELPQLLNILKNEIGFVGPRPERPEFVKLLEEKIPYYQIRHMVKPGITGWAQINYRYGSSVEDAYEKLQYDIFYIKNRSAILDIAILIKTLKSFFINHQ